MCSGTSYLVKRYGTVIHLLHTRGVRLVHLLPGQAAEPIIGPRLLVQPDSLWTASISRLVYCISGQLIGECISGQLIHDGINGHPLASSKATSSEI